MSRISPVNPERSSAETAELLAGVRRKLGMTPNMMATMGQSSAVLKGYLNFSDALSHGLLSPRLREQIALAVGQANSCEYCLSAHSAVGKMVGLSAVEIAESRRASSSDPKSAAALRFAQEVVVRRGEVDDSALRRLRESGFTDPEVVEIVANVAINIFTNYLNHVAKTEVDFARVPVELAA